MLIQKCVKFDRLKRLEAQQQSILVENLTANNQSKNISENHEILNKHKKKRHRSSSSLSLT